MIVAFAVFLVVHLLPAGAAIALVLIVVVPVAACEAMQAAVVPAVVTESATPRTLGRYTSAYQVTFSIGDIIVPASSREPGRAPAGSRRNLTGLACSMPDASGREGPG
jgi:hypothetical protein